MIETVTDFLEEFKRVSLLRIANDHFDITHRPTIGNIYEGLTTELLNKAIFKNLGLKIVQKSFAYNDSGLLSPELDCLLVVGDGIPIAFTDQFKYHIKDIIAVFQIKKNLYGNDIDDSYQNLKSIIDISEPRQAEPFVGQLLRDSYRILTGKDLPSRERMGRFSERESLIYHYLVMEAFIPLRIVIGYYGYKDEYGLREGFIEKIQQKIQKRPVKGYSPYSLPNLIICGDNSIIKNNGMPFGAQMGDTDFYWPILMTSNERSIYYLLELIWTRLTYKFRIGSSIFGDDFNYDTLHRFLFCKERIIDEKTVGWEFNYQELSRKTLSEPLVREEWQPVELSKAQFVILTRISISGPIDIYNDDELVEFLKMEKIEFSSFIKTLLDTRLVFLDEGKIDLLVDELLTVTLPAGKIYGGENKNGQMGNWYFKKIKAST